jgi:hypothetical protein
MISQKMSSGGYLIIPRYCRQPPQNVVIYVQQPEYEAFRKICRHKKDKASEQLKV